MGNYDYILDEDGNSIQVKTWQRAYKKYAVGHRAPSIKRKRTYSILIPCPRNCLFNKAIRSLRHFSEGLLDSYQYGPIYNFIVVRNLIITSIQRSWRGIPERMFSKWGYTLDFEFPQQLPRPKNIYHAFIRLDHEFTYCYDVDIKHSYLNITVATNDDEEAVRAVMAELKSYLSIHPCKELVDRLNEMGFMERVTISIETGAVKRQYQDMEIVILIHRIRDLAPGREFARLYQDMMFCMLTYLFPDFIEPIKESSNLLGTERKDIVFYNSACSGFWHDMKMKHGASHIVFEMKNSRTLKPTDINQVSCYLKEALGNVGIIITREPCKDNIRKKVVSLYNDQRKVVMVLSDGEIFEMVEGKLYREEDPMVRMRELYSRLMQHV